MNLCHVFTFIDEPEQAITQMRQLGFIESYRRQHPGQGTENVCYCFDNMYLELLWVNDPEAFKTEAVKVLQFDQRSLSANPFGIALRGPNFPFRQQPYYAPYLPEGMSISFAQSSDDISQPFLFLSPGSKRPDQGELPRQREVGYSEISKVTLTMEKIHTDYIDLDRRGLISVLEGEKTEMILTLSDLAGKDVKTLSLPNLTLTSL